jgi:DNA-binding IclR family transcriptional regulator
MLAGFSDEKVRHIIDKHGLERRTENTITDPRRLQEGLEKVDQQGFALNDEEQVNGLRAVGAAVEGPDGQVIGAVSLSAPKPRMRDKKFTTEMPDLVMNTANLIELNLDARNTGL